MPHTLDPIAERALAINLDPEIYGSADCPATSASHIDTHGISGFTCEM